MNRKEFLRTSMLTGVGLSFGLPAFSLHTPLITPTTAPLILTIEDELFYVSLLRKFAATIGTTVIADVISEYVKDFWFGDDRNLKEAINNTNRNMRKQGFSDFSNSEVHQAPNESIMYQVSDPDNANVCAPVFKLDKSKDEPAAMLEAPSLAALSVVGGMFKSKKDAADWLLPVHERVQGVGSLEDGYENPAIYLSKKGVVKIDYKNKKRGQGVANVGITDGRNKVIFDKPIDINYYS